MSNLFDVPDEGVAGFLCILSIICIPFIAWWMAQYEDKVKVKPEPTVEQCKTILNKNPEMCLSVCVDVWEQSAC